MRYTKKPITIEAFQMTKEARWTPSKWPSWLLKAWDEGTVAPLVNESPSGEIFVATLEGNHSVSWGDFIIQGIKNEIYPCKPDIFTMTYDEAS